MITKKTKLFFLFVWIVLLTNGQNLQDRIWIFGSSYSGSTNATLYFGNPSNPITSLPCGQPNQISASNGVENWVVATNPFNGNLLFYTDGQYVYDHFHNVVDLDPAIPGYELLGASSSSSQPAAVVTVPGTIAGQFFVFNNPTGASGLSYSLGPVTYRIFDAVNETFGPLQSLPGPYGSIDVTEGLKVIQSDADPSTLWLITSLYPSTGNETRYVVYQIQNSTITYAGYQDFGPTKQHVDGSLASPIINIAAAKGGTLYGITQVAFALQKTSSIYTIQFDNINGQFLPASCRTLTTGIATSIPGVDYIEFSPNGRFIYYTIYFLTYYLNGLYQVDLQDSTLTSTEIHTFNGRYAGGLRLAPDGLIYHIHDGGYISHSISVGRILQPDVKYIPGVTVFSSFYEESFQVYNDCIGYGLCEFLILSKDLILEKEELQNKGVSSRISPNPSNNLIHFSIEGLQSFDVYNCLGELVEKNVVILDNNYKISSLSPGLYFIRAKTDYGIIVDKFVKQE